LTNLGFEAWDKTRSLLNTLEISHDFDIDFWIGIEMQNLAQRLERVLGSREIHRARVSEIELLVDNLVSGAYSFPWKDFGDQPDEVEDLAPEYFEANTIHRESPQDALRELISASVGIRLGALAENRFDAFQDADNIVPILEVLYFDDDLSAAIPSILKGAFNIREDGLISTLENTLEKPVKAWLSRDFYPYHVKMYKNAPIYWMITSPKGHFKALTYIHRLSLDTFATCRSKYVQPLLEKLKSQQNALGSSDPKRAAALEAQIQDIRELDDLLYDLILKAPKLDFDEGVVANHERFATVLRKLK
jgi:hypothetical protein